MIIANQSMIRTIIGVTGNVISCGLFLSPMPTYIQIIKSKDVKKFSPIPYLATLLNCLLWFFYGLPIVHPNSLLVITINSIGIAFEVFYLTVFLIYASRQSRKLVIQTKSVEFMPFTLSLASFLNGVCWTSYGFLPFDINLLVPNGLGTLFGLAQLILYACYFKSTPNKNAQAELELPV
ncbi:hypothetical protein ZIOFF_044271 [Zingiber officinale]|uniref:Uncharacterized protein n=1 Tax=Zingiber officinale TaxID=94328 RepID=A0A8J5KUD3_ZINOF|nr:hypothetical protein ZIOFF_044271 [Zingiber officinale]